MRSARLSVCYCWIPLLSMFHIDIDLASNISMQFLVQHRCSSDCSTHIAFITSEMDVISMQKLSFECWHIAEQHHTIVTKIIHLFEGVSAILRTCMRKVERFIVFKSILIKDFILKLSVNEWAYICIKLIFKNRAFYLLICGRFIPNRRRTNSFLSSLRSNRSYVSYIYTIIGQLHFAAERTIK